MRTEPVLVGKHATTQYSSQLCMRYIETTIADNETAASGLSKQQPASRTQDDEDDIYISCFDMQPRRT